VFANQWETTIRPGGLRHILRANFRWDRPTPVLVAENGMANRVVDGRSYRRRDGWTRPAFLRAHVAELLQAARDGVDVAGYLHGTLADTYEWGSYEPRFGLHGVDRRGEVRLLGRDALGHDSAGTYRNLVEALRRNDGGAALAALQQG
jgi:beta-glucosidase